MFYQEMIMGQQPYYVSIGHGKPCNEHRHPEIELSFCARGSYEFQIEKNTYLIPQNHLLIVGSMLSHRLPGPSDPQVLTLTIDISPILLMEYFEPFSKVVFPNPVFSLDQCDPRLSDLLHETVALCQNRTGFSELMIRGNLYKICCYIYEEFVRQTNSDSRPKSFRDIQKVEEAIQLIHSHYAQPITLAQVAALTQYSESHFCRIFKKITGTTFHNVLNRCRIKNACCLLKETTDPIAEIALQVGFTDMKAFCRVFKQYTGYSPRSFRNNESISLNDLAL